MSRGNAWIASQCVYFHCSIHICRCEIEIDYLLIGTHCIEHGHDLLHDDRDFVPMAQHLGLRVL
jgi:predicted nucleic acid-binding protein